MALQKRTGFFFSMIFNSCRSWTMAGSGAASKLMKVAFQKLLAKDSGNFNSVLSKVICIKHGGPRGVNFFRFPGGGEDSPFKDLPVPRKHICYHGRGGGKCPHCCHSSLLPMMTRIKLDSKYEPIWPLGQCILQTCIRNYWIWHIIWKRIFIFYENVFKRKYV